MKKLHTNYKTNLGKVNKKTCPECHGSGMIICQLCEGKGRKLTNFTCQDCSGRGRVNCPACSGSGNKESSLHLLLFPANNPKANIGKQA